MTNPIYGNVAGYPVIMPVIKEANDKYNIGDTWHTDMSYMEVPPLGSILYARDVPEYGGDTLFANMYLAYDMLPQVLKSMLEGRHAYHSDWFLTSRVAERNAGRSTQLWTDLEQKERLALHPIVRTHDETGRKCLYVNSPFTWSIEGVSRRGAPKANTAVRSTEGSPVSREESLPILNQHYAHTTRPEFTCRFRWRKGSLAFWDNRCAMHYACNDYQGKRREMYRMTIAGTRPT